MTAPAPTTGFQLPRIDPAWTRLAVGVVATALLAWAGVRATGKASVRRGEIARAETALRGFADLRQRYTPAVAAESIAWRRTWMALQDLGVAGDERLALTRLVSQSAESAGLENVRVTVGPSDTTGLERRLSTEGIDRTPASFSLVVEGRGGLRPVVAFLGRLPSSVAVTQVTLARQGSGSARSRIALAVYELAYPNGQPPSNLWSSLERGAAGRGGGDRPGG